MLSANFFGKNIKETLESDIGTTEPVKRRTRIIEEVIREEEERSDSCSMSEYQQDEEIEVKNNLTSKITDTGLSMLNFGKQMKDKWINDKTTEDEAASLFDEEVKRIRSGVRKKDKEYKKQVKYNRFILLVACNVEESLNEEEEPFPVHKDVNATVRTHYHTKQKKGYFYVDNCTEHKN